jgi:DNA-binding MarR family transcriptional regulator
MQDDLENPTTESQLSEICQVIANPNARRMLAILAGAPMSLRDLEERFDLTPEQLRSAAEMMVKLQLLKKSKGAKRERPVTYQLAEGGLLLVRSWLDRIASIQVGEG